MKELLNQLPESDFVQLIMLAWLGKAKFDKQASFPKFLWDLRDYFDAQEHSGHFPTATVWRLMVTIIKDNATFCLAPLRNVLMLDDIPS